MRKYALRVVKQRMVMPSGTITPVRASRRYQAALHELSAAGKQNNERTIADLQNTDPQNAELQIVYGRQTSGRLNRDELDVNPGCFRKCAQVAGIRGEDVVAVGCEAYHSGVNGIGLAAAGKQHPGSPSQSVVDGSDIGAGQEPGHGRLPSAAAAPDLGDHAAAGDRRASGETFALD